MQTENMVKLENALAILKNTAKQKQNMLRGLRLWMGEFSADNPATPGQIAEKFDSIDVNDIQSAFDDAKDIFLNPDIIQDPVD